MLARLLRRIASLVIVPIAWALQGIADAANLQRCENLQNDLHDERHQRQLAEDKAVRLTADIEHSLAWRDKELARLRSEADIHRAKSVLSTESPERE